MTARRTFPDAVAFGRPIVLDGGLATQLESRGHDLSDSLWSARLLLDDPAEVSAAHRDFFAAGAQVATTASYQASATGFAAAGLPEGAFAEAITRSVAAARSAAGDHGWVAASVGPYGASLADGSEYRGNYGLSVAQLQAWHTPRLRAVMEAAPDLLALETIPSLDEVRALTAALTELASRGGSPTPFWLSVTPAHGRLRTGEPLEDAFALAADTPGCVAVGANCCDPAEVDAVVDAAHDAAPGVAVVFYPNSGEVWDATSRTWTGTPTIGRLGHDWVTRGVTLVGGCCRVTPAEIAALSASLTSSAAR